MMTSLQSNPKTEPARGNAIAHRCPLCASADASTIIELPNLPVDIGRLWPHRASAKEAPRGDVILSFCHGCGFVFNSAYDPKKLEYQPGYEYSLHHSPKHRAFLDQTADRLIATYDLHGKDIVEVGCGSGFFLKLLCARGGNRGHGFDPAVDEQREFQGGNGTVTLSPEFYDQLHSNVPCDLLVSRSMFELIPQPLEFLRSMRRTLGNRTDARVYLDIPNTSYVFRQRALWNLFYEQCNYFVEATLIDAFQRAGFRVLDSGECLGDGYYLYVEAAPADGEVPMPESGACELSEELDGLADHLDDQLALWQQRCDAWNANHQRVVAWGSGGRAINFLNLTAAGDCIDQIVDINPARHGGFVSGSGQQIIAPEELRALRPDVIVITNGLYGTEIRQQVASLGIECEFVEI